MSTSDKPRRNLASYADGFADGYRTALRAARQAIKARGGVWLSVADVLAILTPPRKPRSKP